MRLKRWNKTEDVKHVREMLAAIMQQSQMGQRDAHSYVDKCDKLAVDRRRYCQLSRPTTAHAVYRCPRVSS